MKQLFCTLFILLLTCNAAFSQTTVTLYYNAHNQLTTQDKATTIKEATIDITQLQLNGPFRDYDKLGNLIAEGNYSHGIKAGVFKTYKADKLESAIEFTDNSFIVKEWADKNGQQQVVNGTGSFTIPYYFINPRVIGRVWTLGMMHGEVKDGKRVGKWSYENEKKQVTNEEFYEEGVLLKKIEYIANNVYESNRPVIMRVAFPYEAAEAFDLDAAVFQRLYQYFELYPVKDTDTVQRDIAYPGGMASFLREIATQIRYPSQDTRYGVQGQVIVSLVVDDKGQLKDVKVIKSVSPTLDAEAVRVIKLVAPKLAPALLDGKPYESVMSIPVSFRIG